MSEIENDDGWIELSKQKPSPALKPTATIALTPPARGSKGAPKVRATIWLRREAAEWARANGPRFRAQIGGDNCNLVRLVPDSRNGQFEAGEFKGVIRIGIGNVNLWPNEIRTDVVAEIAFTPAGAVLTLPVGFARAGQGPAPQAPVAVVKAPPANASLPGAFPITTTARGLERQSKAVAQQRRVVGLGEPEPGRSALDKLRGDKR